MRFIWAQEFLFTGVSIFLCGTKKNNDLVEIAMWFCERWNFKRIKILRDFKICRKMVLCDILSSFWEIRQDEIDWGNMHVEMVLISHFLLHEEIFIEKILSFKFIIILCWTLSCRVSFSLNPNYHHHHQHKDALNCLICINYFLHKKRWHEDLFYTAAWLKMNNFCDLSLKLLPCYLLFLYCHRNITKWLGKWFCVKSFYVIPLNMQIRGRTADFLHSFCANFDLFAKLFHNESPRLVDLGMCLMYCHNFFMKFNDDFF